MKIYGVENLSKKRVKEDSKISERVKTFKASNS